MKFKKVKKENLVFSDNEKLELDESRRFRGVAYSGNIIENHPFWGNLAFDISTMSAKSKIPILYNHDMDKVVGSGSLTFANNVSVDGQISDQTKYGKESYHLIKDLDFPMQESVYIEPESVVTLKQKETITVNGKQLTGPGTVLKGGKIKEVSLTPLGADSDTSTTIFNKDLEINIMEEDMPKKEEKKLTDLEKFEKLFTESPEKAFEFACQCESKKTKTSDDDELAKVNEDLAAAVAKLEELEAENEKLKAEKSEKASLERKDKLEKVFSDLGVTLNDELLASYQDMSEDRFSKVLVSLEKDAEKVNKERKKKVEDLTTFKKIDSPDEKKVDNKKAFTLARELREKDTSLSVVESIHKAREQLSAE